MNRKAGPLVSVLLSTYNRPQYVRQAVESILRQTHRNVEAIVVRDGGTPVGDLKAEYNDPRLIFINRDQNRGLPYSFNEALEHARGQYVCYLGDDDILYPHHVATLLDALEGQDEYGAAYSDLYKVHHRIMPDGARLVLAKNVEISRDFDRMALLQFNHILHVSLMHRRDLLDRVGPCNENLNVLIDFDLTRRLSFFTDFKHVHTVTGEFYAPIGDCDRISVQKRKDEYRYIYNLLTIRSTRPAKPWPKMADLSIILLAEGPLWQLEQSLRTIWAHTFFPYQIYLPLAESDLRHLNTAVPNIVPVVVSPGCTPEERFDAALARCEGDFVAAVPSGYTVEKDEVAWIEKSVNPLIGNPARREALELVRARPGCWGAIAHRADFLQARRSYKHLPLRQSLEAAGITVRKPQQEEWPFQFENLVTTGMELEKQGDWATAVKVYAHTREHYGNDLWMQTRSAYALYHAQRHDEALQIIGRVNEIRATPATLLIAARSHKQKENYQSAIRYYRQCLEILGSDCFPWDMYTKQDYGAAFDDEKRRALKLHRDQAGRPSDEENMDTIKGTKIPDNGWTQHYDVMKELGDCHAMVGEYEEAQKCYDRAAVLAPDEAGPYVGSGVVELQKGNLANAEAAFRVACRLDPTCSKAYCGLAIIRQQQQACQEAFDLYLKSLDLDKNNLTALLGLFQLSCQTGSFARVIECLEVYLETHPGDISVMFCLATLHMKDRRLTTARRLLKDILILDPANSEAADLLEEVEHSLAQTTHQEVHV
ncbi:MAG: glycosyltransferase [Anaerohalosphaeraceae bacterium]|jgi:glycosyltransferase involved in cell wall biosynthesis/tetratricopeptide (TPR) repeat protein